MRQAKSSKNKEQAARDKVPYFYNGHYDELIYRQIPLLIEGETQAKLTHALVGP